MDSALGAAPGREVRNDGARGQGLAIKLDRASHNTKGRFFAIATGAGENNGNYRNNSAPLFRNRKIEFFEHCKLNRQARLVT
jgi:hypothetical protein